MGLTPTQAAKRAKFSDPRKAAKRLMATPELAERIKEITVTIRKEFAISRMDVQKGIAEAIEMARLQADPVAMIRGWQEVNKMCGFYAPEERKITLTDGQSGSLRAMQVMPLHELIDLAEGEIIEAELLDDPEDVPDAEDL